MSAQPATAPILARYAPPVRDVRFWAVQVLVAAIFVTHQLVAGEFGIPEIRSLPHMAIDALYLAPVLYAALNFSLPGALATAAWVTVLVVADMALASDLTLSVGLEHVSVLLMVDVVAAFVGIRVNAEVAARAQTARAEARYRALFEAYSSPVVVLDSLGRVRDANPAAIALFGLSGDSRVPGPLAETVPLALVAPIRDGSDDPFPIVGPDGSERLVRAAPAAVVDPAGEALVQVVLQDVTAEARRRERAETYAARILRAQEDERRHLAQELHDDSVQELIHLCRQLDRIAGAPAGPDQSATIADARALAEGIVAGLRDIARGLRPPALDDLGLAAALRRLAADAAERSGVRVEADLVETDGIGANAELVVFRIAQEALNNVERHARATSASLRLRRTAAGIELEVADDGVGFTVPASLDEFGGEGLGLAGMDERSRLVGGSLQVDSTPGRGTNVRVTLPPEP